MSLPRINQKQNTANQYLHILYRFMLYGVETSQDRDSEVANPSQDQEIKKPVSRLPRAKTAVLRTPLLLFCNALYSACQKDV